MPHDIRSRFDFLVNDVARRYGRRFDRVAREQIGLSRAQCRLLAVLALQEDGQALTQAALAEQLDLTPMGVATLCERMEAAGWIKRHSSPTDKRVNMVSLEPRADEALGAALAIGDLLQAQALAGLSPAERTQLVALLKRVHANLV
jgi:DNA-binding MarR family transcriptional regulator